MRSHYVSGNRNNGFEQRSSFFYSPPPLPPSLPPSPPSSSSVFDLSRGNLFSYFLYIFSVLCCVAWMGDRVRLENDRHDLRVLYSLFTHCLHTFGARRPLKISICGQDVITVNCGVCVCALCLCMCMWFAAMFVFFERNRCSFFCVWNFCLIRVDASGEISSFSFISFFEKVWINYNNNIIINKF